MQKNCLSNAHILLFLFFSKESCVFRLAFLEVGSVFPTSRRLLDFFFVGRVFPTISLLTIFSQL